MVNPNDLRAGAPLTAAAASSFMETPVAWEIWNNWSMDLVVSSPLTPNAENACVTVFTSMDSPNIFPASRNWLDNFSSVGPVRPRRVLRSATVVPMSSNDAGTLLPTLSATCSSPSRAAPVAPVPTRMVLFISVNDCPSLNRPAPAAATPAAAARPNFLRLSPLMRDRLPVSSSVSPRSPAAVSASFSAVANSSVALAAAREAFCPLTLALRRFSSAVIYREPDVIPLSRISWSLASAMDTLAEAWISASRVLATLADAACTRAAEDSTPLAMPSPAVLPAASPAFWNGSPRSLVRLPPIPLTVGMTWREAYPTFALSATL